MTKPATSEHGARRGKGHLSAPHPQARFILFLIFLLVTYTFLLKLFQKIASIIELPLFVPIALVILLIFIGVAGVVYSHRFVGPLARIRSTLEQVAKGDCSVSLRLRESDDPMLQNIASVVVSLCDHNRNAHNLVREAAQDLFQELTAFEDVMKKGAHPEDLQKHLERVHKKKILFEHAVQSLGK
jgi:nitrogen fixation/metabolism regulation signal transduction histidine kinase